MKKFALAAAAFATVFSGAAMAAPSLGQQNDRGPSHQVEQRHDVRQDGRQDARHDSRQDSRHASYRDWKKGDRFDSRQARNYRVISQPRAHGLKTAPRGYRWVQSGNDAVLIGVTSGVVASVLANIMH